MPVGPYEPAWDTSLDRYNAPGGFPLRATRLILSLHVQYMFEEHALTIPMVESLEIRVKKVIQ